MTGAKCTQNCNTETWKSILSMPLEINITKIYLKNRSWLLKVPLAFSYHMADSAVEDLAGLATPAALCHQKPFINTPGTCSERLLPVNYAIDIYSPVEKE